MEEEVRRSLLLAVGRMAGTLERAEGAVRQGKLNKAIVSLVALEEDAQGSAQALANTLCALDDLKETKEALKEAYDEGGR